MDRIENAEDILSESLEFLGGEQAVDDGQVCYGPLSLTVAPKARREGEAINADDQPWTHIDTFRRKANTLLADHLFSPSFFLAERIERELIPASGCSVIELGAGCALPSLLMATLPQPPAIVVVTDYPDDTILGNLEANVNRNWGHYQSGCSVRYFGYEWGKDVGPLLSVLPPRSDNRPLGYDIVILSDLLHFHASHDVLLLSLTSLLSQSETSRVYVAAGNYTPPDVCDHFLRNAEKLGIAWNEGEKTLEEAEWLGTFEVTGLDKVQLASRKNVCRWWLGRWSIFTT